MHLLPHSACVLPQLRGHRHSQLAHRVRQTLRQERGNEVEKEMQMAVLEAQLGQLMAGPRVGFRPPFRVRGSHMVQVRCLALTLVQVQWT